MKEEERRHLAYLVRLVRADRDGPPLWRIAVEDAHSGEKLGFANLDELCSFLREQMGADVAHSQVILAIEHALGVDTS